jgi:hypothetical protein
MDVPFLPSEAQMRRIEPHFPLLKQPVTARARTYWILSLAEPTAGLEPT